MLLAAAAAAVPAYAAMRPALREAYHDLVMVELPLVLMLGTLAFLVAFGRAPALADAPAWRRHEQVVRPVPDPEATRVRDLFARYVEQGSDADEAAGLLAQAMGETSADRAALRARLAAALAEPASRNRRAETLLRHLPVRSTRSEA